MNISKLCGILLAFLCSLAIVGCDDDESQGRKITDYKEYTLTIASKMLPGVVTSCGNSTLTDVYAVKNESQAQWQPLGYIAKFDYEPGYEYQIRIRATSYLDQNMGEPAWTEYELLEVLSKERKESEDLPEDFIPDWFENPYRLGRQNASSEKPILETISDNRAACQSSSSAYF